MLLYVLKFQAYKYMYCFLRRGWGWGGLGLGLGGGGGHLLQCKCLWEPFMRLSISLLIDKPTHFRF